LKNGCKRKKCINEESDDEGVFVELAFFSENKHDVKRTKQ
jgi:hypothetical protein